MMMMINVKNCFLPATF